MQYAHLNKLDLIYFVEADVVAVGKLIKISATSNFGIRFTALCSSCPCELTLRGALLCPTNVEEREVKLHEQFALEHHHADWFRLSERLEQWIVEKVAIPKAVNTTPFEQETALEPLVDIDEIARMIKVSTATIRRYVRERHIPFVRIGRQLRFDRREFTEVNNAASMVG
jgi:excisionase family DNA binding protein